MEDIEFDQHYLAEWRKFAELTQEEVGEALGVTGAQVSRIENGTRVWDRLYLHKYRDLINETLARKGQTSVRINQVWELLACKPDPFSLIVQASYMEGRWEEILTRLVGKLRPQDDREATQLPREPAKKSPHAPPHLKK